MKPSKIFLVIIFILSGTSVFAQNYRGTDYQSWNLCRYKGETLTGYCDCKKEIIDRNNEQELNCVRIEPKFKQASVFYNEPYAPAMDASDKWGFINPDGEWVIMPIFERAGVVVAGRSTVTMDGRTYSLKLEEYIEKNQNKDL
jgi:hypothetical protein